MQIIKSPPVLRYFLASILCFAAGLAVLQTAPIYAQEQTNDAVNISTYRAVILNLEVVESNFPNADEIMASSRIRRITAELETGEVVMFEQVFLPELESIELSVGDRVIIDAVNFDGEITYTVTDFQRTEVLLILCGIFVGIVVLVARKKGLYSLLSLGISYFLVFELLIRRVLEGADPLISAIILSAILIPINYYLGHGFSRKTTYAALSTLVTIVGIGVFSVWIVELAKLTGITSDEARFLQEITTGIVNSRDLLLAAIIVGTLGILDDITISQTSIANELKASKSTIKFRELFTRTIRIGRDHIASLVNTLILVYTSASLPLLILLQRSSESLINTINREIVTEEIVIMLLTSIALIVAVPISSLISCFFVDKYGAEEGDGGHGHAHHHH